MLLQLHNFIKLQNVVNMTQLEREFKMDRDTLQPMLAFWIKKGVIASLSRFTSGCHKKCLRCDTGDFYQYQ